MYIYTGLFLWKDPPLNMKPSPPNRALSKFVTGLLDNPQKNVLFMRASCCENIFIILSEFCLWKDPLLYMKPSPPGSNRVLYHRAPRQPT